MLCNVVCSFLLVSVATERIQTHNTFKAQGQVKFGSTCEELQSNFGDRVAGLQTLLDAHPNDSTFNTATRARFTMRTLGIARTMRRARSCSWLVDGDSDDVAQMRGIVQVMLADNPCAPAARAELEVGASGSDDSFEMTSVRRAMSVLVSENCEVTSDVDEEGPTMDPDNEAEIESQLDQAEQQAQDGVDELVEASMNEESSAFFETGSDGRFGGFFRSLGVIILFILLLVACTFAMAWVGIFIGVALLEIGVLTTCRGGFCGLEILFGGAFFGGIVGLGGCAYALTTQLLPAVAIDQNALS